MKRDRRVEQNDRRKRYIELGLCMTCGKKNDTQGRNCQKCLDKIKNQQYKWKLNNPKRTKEIHKKSYLKNRDTILHHAKVYSRNIWLECIYHYSYGTMTCACCGEPIIEFLTIDHINGGGCKHRQKIGVGTVFYHWLIKNGFPEGYQVLCYNCNCGRDKNGGMCPHKTPSIIPQSLNTTNDKLGMSVN